MTELHKQYIFKSYLEDLPENWWAVDYVFDNTEFAVKIDQIISFEAFNIITSGDSKWDLIIHLINGKELRKTLTDYGYDLFLKSVTDGKRANFKPKFE